MMDFTPWISSGFRRRRLVSPRQPENKCSPIPFFLAILEPLHSRFCTTLQGVANIAVTTFRTIPFVPVDCSALVPTLIEAELFGYVKGAFTGAVHTKPGLMKVADKGTLSLDEIGDLPVDLQAKLLRFVAQVGDFLPLAASLVERRWRLSKEWKRPYDFQPGEISPDVAEIFRHEINNPLTGILGNAELVLTKIACP